MSIEMISLDDVKEITLLTKEQAKRLPKEMLACGECWWLRSPGYTQHSAASIFNDGSVYYGGDNVNYAYDCVRPAFIIPNLSSKIGDKIRVGNCTCTVIEKNLVLADDVVCEHRFGVESNDWKSSEIKTFIESDEFKSLLITSKELEFMFDFIEKTDFGYDKSRKQLRSLWTAYCLHDEILKDSASWDINIRRLYTAICKNLSCPWHDDEEEGVLGIELFYSFMEEEL